MDKLHRVVNGFESSRGLSRRMTYLVVTQMLKVVKPGATPENTLFDVVPHMTTIENATIETAMEIAMYEAVKHNPGYTALPKQTVFNAGCKTPILSKAI